MGFDGRQQPSEGGRGRMSREAHVRSCEGLRVNFPGATRRNASRPAGNASFAPLSPAPSNAQPLPSRESARDRS